MEMPERFERLLVMNTGFCPGTGKLSQGFLTWREFCKNTTDLDVGKLIAKDVPHLTKAEIAAYNAPFPDVSYKSGVRIFPSLVPDAPDAPGAEHHRRAMKWFREQHMPVFAAIGVRDPVIGRPGMVKTISQFGAGCSIMELEEAGHFVQEWGKEVARRALKAFDLETQKIRKADVTIARKDMKPKL
jgi:haloalkane dehalogenase